MIMATIKWDTRTDSRNPGYLIVLENGHTLAPAPQDYHYSGRDRRRLKQIVTAALCYHGVTEVDRIAVEPREEATR